MDSTLDFLSHYDMKREEFLNCNWRWDLVVFHIDGMESPSKPNNAQQYLSVRKVMTTVFWDKKRVLLMEFIERGTNINSNVYCELSIKLRRATQKNFRGLLTSSLSFFNNNSRPQNTQQSKNLLHQFKSDVFYHLPYSLGLTSSDFHMIHSDSCTWRRVFHPSTWIVTWNFKMQRKISKLVHCYEKNC